MATGKAPDNPRHVAAAVCCAAVLGLWPALALEVCLSPRGLQFPELGIPLEMLTPRQHSWISGDICPTPDGFDTMKDGELPYNLCENTGHSWTYPMGVGRLSAHPSDGILHVTNTVTFMADAPLTSTMFRIRLPRAEIDGGRWRLDTRSGIWVGMNKPVCERSATLSFDLPRAGRTLTFAFQRPIDVRIQDDKLNKMDSVSLWFGDSGARVRSTGETWRCAFTLAANDPVRFSASKKLTVGVGSGWTPLEYRKDIVAGSALDLSGQGMIDAPAGKYGWLKGRDGHFFFERCPDAPQRFYGVNMCSRASVPPKDIADMVVTRLVRLGYNTIREHLQDTPFCWRAKPGATFDPVMMDRFDYFMARAFKAGIYVTTDLYSSREVAWRDLGEEKDGKVPVQALKGLFMLTERGFANWAAFSRDFLEHVNPYTGRAYKDEPGMPFVSLINENPLSMGWHDLRTYPVIQDLWKKRFGTDDCARVEENDPRLNLFSAEAEEKFCTKAKALLAEIGTKALVTDLTCGGTDPAGRAVRNRLFDYADMHFYIDHPRFPAARWKTPAFVGNRNPLRNPNLRPLTIRDSLEAPSLPFVSSEWSFVGPGRFRGVGGIVTGAVAARDDWAGAWRYTYAHTHETIPSGRGTVGWFDLVGDPLQQAADRAVLCLFLRGDLAAGSKGMRIDSRSGTLAIDTSRTCGGFAESGTISAGALSADIGGVPTTMWVSSVDGNDIAHSRRLVLTHLTDVQAAGTTFGDETRSLLLAWGRTTPMVLNGTATVSIAMAHPGRYDVFALATDGTRLDAVPASHAKGKLTFTVSVKGPDGKARMLYEIAESDALRRQTLPAPSDLTCEYRADPIGIEAEAPRLGWRSTDGQTAWRVRVASTPARLASGEADLWDSGRVEEGRTCGVEYAGTRPAPSQRAYWQVKTWTKAGESAWSAPARWQWGMRGENWQAKWISAGSEIPTPVFTKRFTVREKPVAATLHITGLGYYEASLNGRRIGTKVLDPSPTDYGKTVLYSTYQLENELRPGENVLSVMVGHGLYCVRALSHWWFERAPWKAPPCMIARLELTYGDGRTETVVTDGSWRQVKSPVGYDDFREGEVVGAWHPSLPDYGTDGLPAVVCRGPKGRLVAESHHPAEVTETFAPVSIHAFGDDVQVVEFPKDISGWVRLAIRGARKGDVVSVRYDERVERDFSPVAPSPGYAGRLREPANGPDRRRIDCYFDASASFPVCTKDIGFQTDRIVCSGAGEEIYEPRFTYNGFRYVVIRGLRTPLRPGDITAKFVHTAFPRLASFTCSDPLFNRLMTMADVSYRSNFTDGFPTDCPHREKNGWTGDASFAAELAQYCYGNTSGYEKWLRDICDAQNAQGDIPGIVPSAGWGFAWGNGPAWDSALPVIAWNLYVYRDDRRILDEIYPALKRYLDYTVTKARNGLVRHGLGDWVPPDGRYVPSTEFTSSCYYLQAQQIASRIAAVKGLEEDVARFAAGAEATRAAINARFLKGDGTYDNGGQTAQGMALSFGIVPRDRLAAARARLVASVNEADGKTRMGVLGMKHAFRALSEAGRSDLAFAMITHPGSPSPADWARKGGTALWEDWSDGASRNHIMFGDFACWAYQWLAGIRLPDGGTAATPDPAARAFKEVLIAPAFVPQLSHVKAHVDGIYGRVAVEWRRAGGKIALNVTVPPNSTATLRLPGEPDRKLSSGEHGMQISWAECCVFRNCFCKLRKCESPVRVVE